MKTHFHTLWMTVVATLFSLNSSAQNLFLSYHVLNAPPIPPDSYYAVALSDFGLKRTCYSVLVKIQLPGDTTYYTIPGVLPTGDSFSFRIKVGKWPHSDTLYIIRRGGEKVLQVEDVELAVFHRRDNLLSRPNRRFARELLANFHDANTKRSAPEGTIAPKDVQFPYSTLYPFAGVSPHKVKVDYRTGNR